MIQLEKVYKKYGDQQVLDGVDLMVRKGSITSIIGRSGSGKSVLIRQIIGLEAPDSGSIFIDGQDVVGMKPKELNSLRRRCGFLFQDAALLDSLTVFENVAFPIREHRRLTEQEIRQLVLEKLHQVGMLGHEHKFPAELSGGMKKRVGLARAVALDPDIVLFDEPTTGLDPIMKGVVYDLIERTHKERERTYVMVSHDIQGVLMVSDQVMMLFNGKIVAHGSPEEISHSSDPLIKQFTTGSTTGPIGID